MAAPTDVYIDPSIAGNSGSGTVGDPYGDIQYLLDTHSPDTTNGNYINVKTGTDEIISSQLSLATWGTPTQSAPTIFRGYTSVAGDGGIGGINGNGGAILGSTNYVHFKDMHCHNGGSSTILTLGTACSLSNVEINDTTGNGVVLGARAEVLMCNVHNIGGIGIDFSTGTVTACYCKNGTNDFSIAIRCGSTGTVLRNIISIDGTSKGIDLRGDGSEAISNSIYSNAGSGCGIIFGTIRDSRSIMNNLIQGFSASGGAGIDFGNDDENMAIYANNTWYDNDTHELNKVAGEAITETGNEAASGNLFAFSGSDTFANRHTYFAPADVGSVRGGAYYGSNLDRGAVQHTPSGGGGGSGGGALVLGGLVRA